VNLDALKEDTRKAEGFRERPYLDTVGVWSVGYGHALGRNISRQELQAIHWTIEHAEKVLDEDIASAIHDAASFVWWRTLDEVRQACIVELCFNLGRAKFSGFKKLIAAMQNREYQRAARELEWNTHADGTRTPTQWSRDVGPNRSRRIAKALETGIA
jgi:lysozyme